MVTTMANIKWLDATIWADTVDDENEWNRKLGKIFERYAYGREIAPTTGKKHYQFRGVLQGALSTDCVNYLANLGFRHITPTSVRNFDYVYKDGDYYISWERPRAEWLNFEPRPWQSDLIALPTDGRTVEIVYDWAGNNGKTFIGRVLESQHKCAYIPPLSRGLDICACVMQKPRSKWYVLDFPRSFNLDGNEVWSAIEQVKNGYVYDPRYSFKSLDLGCNPRVTLMVNTLPERIPLSADRIKLYTITHDSLYNEDRLTERPDLVNLGDE